MGFPQFEMVERGEEEKVVAEGEEGEAEGRMHACVLD